MLTCPFSNTSLCHRATDVPKFLTRHLVTRHRKDQLVRYCLDRGLASRDDLKHYFYAKTICEYLQKYGVPAGTTGVGPAGAGSVGVGS